MEMPDAGKCKSDVYEQKSELFLTSLAKWFYKVSKTATEKIGLREETAQPFVPGASPEGEGGSDAPHIKVYLHP